MSRDNYPTTVSCPKCHQVGALFLSEEGNGWTYMRDPSVTVERIEGDFEATGRSDGSVSVRCVKCRHDFIKKP